MGKLLAELISCCALDTMNNLIRCNSGWERGKKMNVVRSYDQFNQFTIKLFDDLRYKFNEPIPHTINKDGTTVFWAPYKVVVNLINGMRCSFVHDITNYIISP